MESSFYMPTGDVHRSLVIITFSSEEVVFPLGAEDSELGSRVWLDHKKLAFTLSIHYYTDRDNCNMRMAYQTIPRPIALRCCPKN